MMAALLKNINELSEEGRLLSYGPVKLVAIPHAISVTLEVATYIQPTAHIAELSA